MSKEKWDFKGYIPKGFIPPENPTYEEGYAAAIEDVLKIIHEALSVWCASYAPDECGKRAVIQARKLKNQHGGTLGYIADVETRIKALLPKGATK